MKKILFVLLSIAVWYSCSEDDPGLPEVAGIEFSDFLDVRDSTIYRCITVNGQTWMAENLRYRHPWGSFGGCYTYLEAQLDSSDFDADPQKFYTAVREAIAQGTIVMPDAAFNIRLNAVNLGSWTVAMFCTFCESTYAANTDLLSALAAIRNDLEVESRPGVAIANLLKAEEKNGGYREEYGYLYSYEGAKSALPEGWALPTDEDWKKLEARLGMKEEELDAWNRWRGQGTGTLLKKGKDGIGFDVLFAGCNAYTAPANMYYTREDVGAYFWSSTLMPETDSTQIGIIRSLTVYDEGIMRATTKLKGYRPVLYSVRCIRKEEDGGQGQN